MSVITSKDASASHMPDALLTAICVGRNNRRTYQFIPLTTKNIGRNWLKTGTGKYSPHQGKRECIRRMYNELREYKNAG